METRSLSRFEAGERVVFYAFKSMYTTHYAYRQSDQFFIREILPTTLPSLAKTKV